MQRDGESSEDIGASVGPRPVDLARGEGDRLAEDAGGVCAERDDQAPLRGVQERVRSSKMEVQLAGEVVEDQGGVRAGCVDRPACV